MSKVDRIVKECERVNQKYSDPHFDIELDLKSGRRHYLDGLDKPNTEMRPRGVKRVTVSSRIICNGCIGMWFANHFHIGNL